MIFLTGVRNSRWMKNALISYYTTWYANSLTFALIGAHQLTITAHTRRWRLHLQFLLLQLFADGNHRGTKTSYTWASVANSCWCCRVRTIISPQKAIVAASHHHQLKSYRWNSWWGVVVFLQSSGQSQRWRTNLSGSKIFGKTLSSAYIFSLFEKQSRKNSSGIWIGRRYTTRHMMMGPFWALAKAVLLKKPGIRLESREKLEIISAKPKWPQVPS